MIAVFGIRHHGPGSARSLRSALEAMQPDCVLVEGPPDADTIVPFAAREGMHPPVALLVHVDDDARRAAFFPFAVYSPEWQALDWALGAGAQVRFADLSMAHGFAWDRQRLEGEEGEAPTEFRPRDPLALLAKAAGYDDAERWWEHMVEERRSSLEGSSGEIFAAILEGMTALRESVGPPKSRRERLREQLREASMRTLLRAAVKEGHERIAFVCGAWHTPVIRPDYGPGGQAGSHAAAREDREILKGLARVKVAATWIPWTYERLTYESGYGAGVESPGWYEHLWLSADEDAVRVGERWLVKVARMLRGEDLAASSAQVIDAVRLAETLATMRGRPLPGLAEMNEASQAVFCLGNAAPMRLIESRLVVGDRLGSVPEDVPQVPLQRNLLQEARRLRLPLAIEETVKELDLRKETDRDRSRLLHRLRLLGVHWGSTIETSGLGTFKEAWRLKWQPEYALRLIEMGAWGNTVEGAAGAFATVQSDRARDLQALTKVLQEILVAELPQAAAHAMRQLQDQAALATDTGLLMDALPSLSRILRYGSVRQSDSEMLGHMVDGMLARIFAGLGPACSSLNDEAAESMFKRVVETHRVVGMLAREADAEGRSAWLDVLAGLIDQPGLHGLLAGRATRLLMESGRLAAGSAADRLSLALSVGSDPSHAASWVEGFLRESGLILIHDERLWALLDRWLETLGEDDFVKVLPLLRRTFSTFSPPERRSMGERARRPSTEQPAADSDETLDDRSARLMLGILARLLGLPRDVPDESDGP